MTKLTFQMTADEFYEGWKYKLKKSNLKNNMLWITIALVVLTIALTLFTRSLLYLFYMLLLIALMVFILFTNKKALKRQFFASPTITGETTLCTYTEGIEIINSYQKIFVPWQSIYSVKETDRLLIILPTYITGIFVISKDRYRSSELNEIISLLKQNNKIEEGK